MAGQQSVLACHDFLVKENVKFKLSVLQFAVELQELSHFLQNLVWQIYIWTLLFM